MDNQTSSILVVYTYPTPVVEVAFNASTQEKTIGGSPIVESVPHNSPLGTSFHDDVFATSPSLDVPTLMSEVPQEGSTQEAPTSGVAQAEVHPEAEDSSFDDERVAYDHDTCFEVVHTDVVLK